MFVFLSSFFNNIYTFKGLSCCGGRRKRRSNNIREFLPKTSCNEKRAFENESRGILLTKTILY